AKSMNAELRAVSIQEKLPPYSGYIDAEVPGGTPLLRQQASEYYRNLQTKAQEAALQQGIALTTELGEGDETEAIVECARRTHRVVLVVGMNRYPLLLSRVWNHTAHDLSQRVASNILGVH